MDEIINAFGIDTRLIIIQIINFAILMAALGYFLYTPVLKLLREREEKIAEGLRDAELAKAAKAEAESEKQGVLAAAHRDAAAVSARATDTAARQASEIVESAQAKAAQLIKDAEVKGEQARKAAILESEKEVAKLAVLAAEKILRERAS